MLSAIAFATATLAAMIAAEGAESPEAFRAAADVFEHRCLSCHDAASHKGGLSLASREEALAGGDSGAAIVPGKAADSFLLDYVTGDMPEMPKDGPPLTAEEIAALRDWIAAGATWPEGRTLQDRAVPDADWWSLQPLIRPAVPPIQNPQSKIQNPIDSFIVERLAEHALPQSPAADRRMLIRRLTFDLLGLPPTPAEIDAFLADRAPDAYERLVDRLLASPHHGERWARHWLDVVHYGETHGYDKDKPRPHAWPYRDYVIRAFNADKPYGRFVEEQIAGDVLYPATADGIEALGFIAAGPWDFIGHAELPETKIDGQVARHLDRDDMVSTTIGTFNSLTVGCAQCHHHKFDPIPQEDYYRLQAVFAAVDRTDKPYDRDPAIARRRGELTSELARGKAEQQRIDAEVARLGGEELARLEQQLAELSKAPAEGSRPEFGYHSAIEPRQDATKWVQVDLGSSHRIARIEYVACHDDFNNIGAGFGFPLQYKIEVSDDAEFTRGVMVLVDRTASDVPNSGVEPQRVEADGVTGRYVRITATKLAPRLANDYIFALAELSVFDAEGTNLTAAAAVTALDSIEAPPRWRRANLIDGYYFGQGGDTAAKLAELREERDRLLDERLRAELKQRRAAAAAAVQAAEKALQELPPQQLVYAGTAFRGSGNFAGTGGQPRTIRLLARGSVTQPGEAVEPGALSCLDGRNATEGAARNATEGAGRNATEGVPYSAAFGLPADHSEGDRRAALARWLSDRRNPLTWRSMANRVWQYHFGRGIVDTPNDFGRMGEQPTHPALLDWLAAELRDRDQSLKHLHRLIVNSHTYRQVSTSSSGQHSASDPATIDADNRYLWRQNRRRLEAEAVRDAVLHAAGRLDTRMGGPSFRDFVIERPEHSPHYGYHLHDPDDPRSHRRSVYRFIVRSQPQPFMTTLDCADPSQRVDKRNESLSALQALALLNNGLMVAMSRNLAQRLEGEATGAADQTRAEAQIDAAFHLALGRAPKRDEQSALVEYARQHGLANACRVLFNLNEFSFVD